MKHILRKLHIGGSHDSFDGRAHDVDGRVLDGRTHVVGRLNSPDAVAQSEATSSSGFSGWFRHTLLPSNNAQSSSRTRLDTAGGAAESAASPRTESDPGAGNRADFKYYEEEYQLQLALALSVSNQNDLDDPESLQIRAAKRISLGRPASPGNTIGDFTAHRYWNYNVLDYEERVVDGFYDVYGVVSDFGNSEKMPSLVDLQGTSLTDMLGYEVVLVNRAIDPDLVQLEQAALCLAVNSGVGESGPQQSGLVQKIADLVVEHMGGPVVDANDMLRRWRTGSYELRTSLNNIVLPLGCLRIGLSRHRALLFKVLADHVGIPCRLVKGSHYTGTDEGAVNIVKVDNDREYIVDLMGAPGTLLPAEMVGATLHLDFLDSTASEEELFSQINQSHITSGNLIRDRNTRDKLNGRRPLVKSEENPSDAHQDWARFDDNTGKRPAGDIGRHLHLGQQRQSSSSQETGFPVSPTRIKDVSQSVMDATQKNPQLVEKLHATFLESGVVSQQDLITGFSSQQSHVSDACNSPAGGAKTHDPSVRAPIASAALQVSSEGSSAANLGISKSNEDEINSRFGKSNQGYKVGGENECKPRRHNAHEKLSAGKQCYLDRWTEHVHSKGDSVLEDVGEWEIPWEEIVIGERIGLGSYGEVYHGDWHGKEVAVKKFLDQDFSGDALDEFISEVRIMRRMEHPNVVLFMGAVTRPPNLSIVTEYLPRGSLFRLLHRPNCQLDEGRRLKMALDVAKGMNYLHTSKPIIVHRDLKSPNLLVDKDWVVKVCDFGLSRMKHHTFLSSKSTAGTPEWMAPEVLRNEPSNEKCDVYSFGVILWELATLQQPWSGINPMQVVGAVGFQNRRLEIPNDVEPSVARIIWECWQSDPGLRPSFSELMVSLEPLGRLIRE